MEGNVEEMRRSEILCAVLVIGSFDYTHTYMQMTVARPTESGTEKKSLFFFVEKQ